jgi:hypothetical protein
MPVKNQRIELQQTTVFKLFGRSALGIETTGAHVSTHATRAIMNTMMSATKECNLFSWRCAEMSWSLATA